MIEELVRRFAPWQAGLPDGASATLELMPPAQRPKGAILDARSGLRDMQTVFRESGDTNVTIVDLSTNEVIVEEYRVLETDEALDRLLADLSRWLRAE